MCLPFIHSFWTSIEYVGVDDLGLGIWGPGPGIGIRIQWELLLHCNLMEVGFRLDIKQLLGWTWQGANINISGILLLITLYCSLWAIHNQWDSMCFVRLKKFIDRWVVDNANMLACRATRFDSHPHSKM